MKIKIRKGIVIAIAIIVAISFLAGCTDRKGSADISLSDMTYHTDTNQSINQSSVYETEIVRCKGTGITRLVKNTCITGKVRDITFRQHPTTDIITFEDDVFLLVDDATPYVWALDTVYEIRTIKVNAGTRNKIVEIRAVV